LIERKNVLKRRNMKICKNNGLTMGVGKLPQGCEGKR